MSARQEGVLVEDCEPGMVQVSLEVISRDGKGERVGYGILGSNPSQVPRLKTTMDSPIGEPKQGKARQGKAKPDIDTPGPKLEDLGIGVTLLSPWPLPLETTI